MKSDIARHQQSLDAAPRSGYPVRLVVTDRDIGLIHLRAQQKAPITNPVIGHVQCTITLQL